MHRSSKGFYSKTLVLFAAMICTLSFFCSGCSYNRQIVFPNIETRNLTPTASTVDVQNVNLEFKTIGTGISKTEGLEASFQKRLIEILREENIKGLLVLEGDVQYSLTGSLEINEKKYLNGLAGVALPLSFLCGLGVVTFPLVFGVMAIPYNNYDHIISADIAFVDTENNATLLQKKYEKTSLKKKFNDYGGNPAKPDSRVNEHLSRLVDSLFKEIATDISTIQNRAAK